MYICYSCIQTSFRDVNINNASAGLRGNVVPTNLAPILDGKIVVSVDIMKVYLDTFFLFSVLLFWIS